MSVRSGGFFLQATTVHEASAVLVNPMNFNPGPRDVALLASTHIDPNHSGSVPDAHDLLPSFCK